MTAAMTEAAHYLLGRYASAPLRVESWGIEGNVLTIRAYIGAEPSDSHYTCNEQRQAWETPQGGTAVKPE